MGHGKLRELGKSISGKSIKARWLRNIFFVTIVILAIISVILIYSIYQRYNHAAQMTLKSCNVEAADTYFGYYANDESAFLKAAADYAESYEYRDRTDIWIIDKNGNPIVSSGGYDVSVYAEMPDYYAALSAQDGTAIKKSENVMGRTRDGNEFRFERLRW